MMATRSIQAPGHPAVGSSAAMIMAERADLNGTWRTETIKASGQTTPREQAGHMTALDQLIATDKVLAKSGPSTHDPGS